MNVEAKSEGSLTLIVGPSGVGKSTVMKELRTRHSEIHFPKSVTTRQRRENEGDDIYHFISADEFKRLIDEDGLIEYAQVHGSAYYGTPKDEILPYLSAGQAVVREVDAQGLQKINVHPLFAPRDEARFKLQSIFLLPENKDQLIVRIKGRAPISDDELRRRMESMEKELMIADMCDHAIINIEGRMDETLRQIEKVIGIDSNPL